LCLVIWFVLSILSSWLGEVLPQHLAGGLQTGALRYSRDLVDRCFAVADIFIPGVPLALVIVVVTGSPEGV
jgi:hypothetical protein